MLFHHAGDLGGPALLVTDRTGVKVPANNPEQAVSELARAMTALGTDPDLRHAMGEAGRQRAGDEYIWEKKGDRLDTLYSSVLGNTVAPASTPPGMTTRGSQHSASPTT